MDFNRDWDDYKNGFGDLDGEFWLGNEAMYYLTKQRKYTMRVVASPAPNTYTYQQFTVEDERNGYKLSIGGYSGSIPGKTLVTYISYIWWLLRQGPFQVRNSNGYKFNNDGYSGYIPGKTVVMAIS